MLFVVTLILLSLSIIAISIKVILKKNGKFSGTCASASPFLSKNSEPCGICGKLPDEKECKESKLNLNWKLAEIKNIQDQISLAKKNDQNAYSYLLETFWDDVYNFQLKRTQNEINAEDIAIESFAKAFEKIDSYDNKYSFKTWLITISKNIHIDKIRKNKNRFNLLELDNQKDIIESSPSPEDNLINEQKLINVKSKIKLLKPLYRKTIELKYFNDLTHKEIAKKLNQPINNIKIRVLRAKKILAEIIKEPWIFH